MEHTFIADFLQWYQRRFSVSTVQSDLELVDLVQKAEQIHVKKIVEMTRTLTNFQENTVKMWQKADHIEIIKNKKPKKKYVFKKKLRKIQKY